MVNTNLKDAPKFIGISFSSMKKSYLKNITKLCDCPPSLLIFHIFHQAIDHIKYKVMPPNSKKKPHENVCGTYKYSSYFVQTRIS